MYVPIVISLPDAHKTRVITLKVAINRAFRTLPLASNCFHVTLLTLLTYVRQCNTCAVSSLAEVSTDVVDDCREYGDDVSRSSNMCSMFYCSFLNVYTYVHTYVLCENKLHANVLSILYCPLTIYLRMYCFCNLPC